jgi:NADPH:quinone reductase-like Zn-dependent oxidoreductase
VPLADGVDDTVAAAFGLSGVAAWSALNLRARVQAGERVLVLGAGGAVGQAAVGVATAQGAAGSWPCVARAVSTGPAATAPTPWSRCRRRATSPSWPRR